MCMLIADDLITAYNEGFSCEDGSIPHGSPGRHFQCKVSLLYVTGDYPALAILTGLWQLALPLVHARQQKRHVHRPPQLRWVSALASHRQPPPGWWGKLQDGGVCNCTPLQEPCRHRIRVRVSERLGWTGEGQPRNNIWNFELVSPQPNPRV